MFGGTGSRQQDGHCTRSPFDSDPVKVPRSIILGLIAAVVLRAKPPADLQARLDAFVASQPGGVSVAWVDRDGVEFFSAGKYSAKDPRPITPDTQFEIGSVTKVFTALLFAESERMGRVHRDDAAAEYLLPAGDPAQSALAKITLLSLATHSAGLPKVASDFPLLALVGGNPYARITRADLVESLRIDGPGARAGHQTAYSNFGVALLGEAVATAWGVSYESALRTHVLDPLGMKATVLGLPGRAASPELAPPHRHGRPSSNWESDGYAPCGAVRSSAREMAKLLQACLGDEHAPLHASLVRSTTRQRDLTDLPAAIGYNWILSGTASRPVIWHNGATGGYHSWLGFTRVDGGTGVVVLTNHDVSVDQLGSGMLGMPRMVFHPSPVKYGADYEGRYQVSPHVFVEVTAEQGGLMARVTAQPPRPLRELGPDDFVILGQPAELEFERDRSGKIVGLVRHQGHHDQRAARVPIPSH
ncbi:MAG: serine hydrolase [Verrucomicrobia bacterium]|nr:serine hydrolase [Verrucomicrobiota bacterium]